ncbi:MAG: hypothetical protein MPW14_18740 [Candidatus Manganitrophus sp.]|nr:MAG: hypothetical protein MPW14_18740 [Candidatus Manganitrophus sp.]
MSNPLISFLTGLGSRRVVETVLPRRTLEEVVLPLKPGERSSKRWPKFGIMP